MGDTWGNRIKLTIFGESHGEAIGVVIDGLPAGIEICTGQIAVEMARRAPGQSAITTSRKEADEAEILSGFYAGKTTGSALCAVIRNTNTRSQDYTGALRPGHADWTALLKHKGFADMRGGGHFSGRLTAPLVFAGAVAKQVLFGLGVTVRGRIVSIEGIKDLEETPDEKCFLEISEKDFPVFNNDVAREMKDAILLAKSQKDSVGGVVEVAAFGVPGGLGDPFFSSIESVSASLFFSIPAVKGLEFGRGFALAQMRGSKANDAIVLKNGKICAETNNNGGILGGITNGMPVVARIGVKPTASIALAQKTVDVATMREIVVETRGRHDPCIVPRSVPVCEAALALAILDAINPGQTSGVNV